MKHKKKTSVDKAAATVKMILILSTAFLIILSMTVLQPEANPSELMPILAWAYLSGLATIGWVSILNSPYVFPEEKK